MSMGRVAVAPFPVASCPRQMMRWQVDMQVWSIRADSGCRLCRLLLLVLAWGHLGTWMESWALRSTEPLWVFGSLAAGSLAACVCVCVWCLLHHNSSVPTVSEAPQSLRERERRGGREKGVSCPIFFQLFFYPSFSRPYRTVKTLSRCQNLDRCGAPRIDSPAHLCRTMTAAPPAVEGGRGYCKRGASVCSCSQKATRSQKHDAESRAMHSNKRSVFSVLHSGPGIADRQCAASVRVRVRNAPSSELGSWAARQAAGNSTMARYLQQQQRPGLRAPRLSTSATRRLQLTMVQLRPSI